jgi:magnesium chelatase family protein
MLVKLHAAALRGVDAVPVTVEVRVDRGIHFLMVGLPDSAVRESQQRIKSAIEHLGFRWPGKGITINLAPAGLRKEGAAYDLPLAIGILAASEQIERDGLAETLMMGELALDGGLRPVRGGLALAQAATLPGMGNLILPRASAEEAALLPAVQALPADHLSDVLDHFSGSRPLEPIPCDLTGMLHKQRSVSMGMLADIRGQDRAIAAMALAAAGGHNVCMVGPPGSGKSMLARAMAGLLPPLTVDEAIEVNRIHSVSDRQGQRQGVVLQRPFRSPHHTISDVALVGGGSDPRPGEISLAHAGVLFLDELPEMPRNVLEVLRQPMESGEMVVSRARSTVQFPAAFQLVAAMNPCPCGMYSNDPDKRKRCGCSRHARQQYIRKVSGPLLDRIDIHLEIEAVSPRLLMPELDHLADRGKADRQERAFRWREKVHAARRVQALRNPNGMTNHRLDGQALHDLVLLDGPGRRLLERSMEHFGFSARTHTRLLRMARTLADLEERSSVQTEDIAEAIALRRAGRQTEQWLEKVQPERLDLFSS